MNDNQNPSFSSFAGQFLVAMPGIDDSRFEQAVIYLYHHSEENGAHGIIINRPAERLQFESVLTQMSIPVPEIPLPPLLFGGPDQLSHGFILHSSDYKSLMTRIITPDVSLTATQEILQDIAHQTGPRDYLLALGCASWQRGQLEDEVMSNVWITVPANNKILFHTPFSEKWKETLKSVGIDAYRLADKAGKA